MEISTITDRTEWALGRITRRVVGHGETAKEIEIVEPGRGYFGTIASIPLGRTEPEREGALECAKLIIFAPRLLASLRALLDATGTATEANQARMDARDLIHRYETQIIR